VAALGKIAEVERRPTRAIAAYVKAGEHAGTTHRS
jgi:hypothetical protein